MCHHCSDTYRGFSRREVIMGLAASGVAGGLLARGGLAAAESAATQPGSSREKPLIRAAFLRPKEEFWLGWPGTAWDKHVSKSFMENCRKSVGQFAAECRIDVRWEDQPLYDDAAVDRLIAGIKSDRPQGLLLVPLHCLSMGGNEALAFRRNLQVHFSEWRTTARPRIRVLTSSTTLYGRRS
ncbi:MAG TPA: hypothetical protein VLM89_12820, partial [Phycisphaerae bacterium]|nr:hypothetical protein [Phycisphaerae bacterium]